MELEKVTLKLSEEAQKEAKAYGIGETFYGSLTTPDKKDDGAEAQGLTWDESKKMSPIAIEQIRMIVREEIAAQKEQLFEEARKYNIDTNLALFAEAEKLQSLEATSDDTSQEQL